MAVDNVKLPLITDPADTFQREVRNALLLLERRLKTVEGDVTDLEAAPTAGEANTASNLGAGSGVYASKVGVDLRFKSIVAGTGMTVTPGTDDITLAATGSGEANTASNVGAGSQVFKAKTGVDLAFRSVVGSANVTVTQNADDITLTAAAPGETNTASNLGAGSGLYASKSGADLRFKSLVAGTNVTLTAGANDVTIAAPFTGFGEAFLGDGSDGALTFDGVAAVLGVSPAAGANPYVGSTTYTMTRDIFATSIAISSGVVVLPAGYRIWCTGDIAGPGKIARNGVNGNSTSTSSAGTGGGAQGSNLLGGSGNGGNGGGGGNPAANGTGGGNSATAPYGYTSGTTGTTAAGGNTGVTGGVGQGGAGGSGASNTGGGSGTTTLITNANGPYVSTLPQCLTGRSLNNSLFTGGSGGGGGSGGFATSGPTTGAGGGGGGGGGAGPVVVAARSFSGGAAIESKGGGGGNGAAATGAGVAGGGGGGGGGGGSWATVCYAEGSAPTVTVTGGTGGTGGTGVGGGITGGNGGNGGAGLAYIFNLGA